MALQSDTGIFQTTSLLRWRNVACAVGVCILYHTWKVIYRLYLSPLSHIPGRKLAGMSNNIRSVPLVRFKLPEPQFPALVKPVLDLNFGSRIEPLPFLS